MNIELDNEQIAHLESASLGLRPFNEFDWFGVDSAGQIAMFASAGFGPVPLAVFRDRSAYFSTAAYLEKLPVLATDIRHGHQRSGGTCLDWLRAAQRGLFAYDWNSTSAGQYVQSQPYSLIASPNVAITFKQLPASIQEYLAPIRFGSPF